MSLSTVIEPSMFVQPIVDDYCLHFFDSPRAYVRYFTSQLLPFLSLCRELKKTDAEVAHEIAKWLSGNHAGSFTHILKEQERHAMTKTHLQDVLDRLLLRQNDIVELRADHDAKFAKQEEKNAKQEAEILTLNEEISALKDNMKYVLSVVLNHATSANAATEVITNVSKAHLEDTA